jgi:hypothetical protein
MIFSENQCPPSIKSEGQTFRDQHTPMWRVGYGQMYPAPLGFGKHPTDCGSSFFGSHSTMSGKKIVNAMAAKKMM